MVGFVGAIVQTTMEKQIIIDSNAGEDPIYEFLAAKYPDVVKRERLHVGDIVLRSNGHTLIVERKHVPDLISSLGDQRYSNQKARQLAAAAEDESGKTRVIWIVEGAVQTWHSIHPPPVRFKNSQLEAAIVCTAVRDCIPVLRARDSASLCETLAYLYEKLVANELDGVAKAQRQVAEGYAGTIKVVKAKNKDAATTWELMLTNLQGMSAAKAKLVAAEYPTPRALAKYLAKYPEKEAIAKLASIQVGGNRKLGKVLAARLREVMLGEGK